MEPKWIWSHGYGSGVQNDNCSTSLSRWSFGGTHLHNLQETEQNRPAQTNFTPLERGPSTLVETSKLHVMDWTAVTEKKHSALLRWLLMTPQIQIIREVQKMKTFREQKASENCKLLSRENGSMWVYKIIISKTDKSEI